MVLAGFFFFDECYSSAFFLFDVLFSSDYFSLATLVLAYLLLA